MSADHAIPPPIYTCDSHTGSCLIVTSAATERLHATSNALACVLWRPSGQVVQCVRDLGGRISESLASSFLRAHWSHEAGVCSPPRTTTADHAEFLHGDVMAHLHRTA